MLDHELEYLRTGNLQRLSIDYPGAFKSSFNRYGFFRIIIKKIQKVILAIDHR